MTTSAQSPANHPLAPLPLRLAKLLAHATDKQLAGKVERWMERNSGGKYPHLHFWLDDTDPANLDLRRELGTKACEIIESENLAALEEGT